MAGGGEHSQVQCVLRANVLQEDSRERSVEVLIVCIAMPSQGPLAWVLLLCLYRKKASRIKMRNCTYLDLELPIGGFIHPMVPGNIDPM